MGSENPFTIHEIYTALTPSDSRNDWASECAATTVAAKQVENYNIISLKFSYLYNDDILGVEGRLLKARRVLNAVSGLCICRNGLSVATCCIIFGVIDAAIALFTGKCGF